MKQLATIAVTSLLAISIGFGSLVDRLQLLPHGASTSGNRLDVITTAASIVATSAGEGVELVAGKLTEAVLPR